MLHTLNRSDHIRHWSNIEVIGGFLQQTRVFRVSCSRNALPLRFSAPTMKLQNLNGHRHAMPRTAFFISDGTGITAESLGRSLLAQFKNLEIQMIQALYRLSRKSHGVGEDH